MRKRGKITNWNEEKGYGFITPASSAKQVFVHIRAFKNRHLPPELNQVVLRQRLGLDAHQVVITAVGTAHREIHRTAPHFPPVEDGACGWPAIRCGWRRIMPCASPRRDSPFREKRREKRRECKDREAKRSEFHDFVLRAQNTRYFFLDPAFCAFFQVSYCARTRSYSGLTHFSPQRFSTQRSPTSDSGCCPLSPVSLIHSASSRRCRFNSSANFGSLARLWIS